MAWNFAAGPAALPDEVLARARDELLVRDARAESLPERRFMGAEVGKLMDETEQALRSLLGVPSSHAVLWIAGGATPQFGLLPLQLARPDQSAAYVESGYWSGRALLEARRHCRAVRAASSLVRDERMQLPPTETWQLPSDAAYCHYTANETADGAEFHVQPDTGTVPLVADMSSSLLSRPLDVARHGLIYASGQKNLGAGGLCVLLVRRDLLARPDARVPQGLSYAAAARERSRHCTPPVFAIAVLRLMLDWVCRQGGVEAMAAAAARRSACVYRAIDLSAGFYRTPVAVQDRSRINVCFRLREETLLERFLQDAEHEGLLNLDGHARVGGVRASLYNALPEAAAQALAAYLTAFAKRHG